MFTPWQQRLPTSGHSLYWQLLSSSISKIIFYCPLVSIVDAKKSACSSESLFCGITSVLWLLWASSLCTRFCSVSLWGVWAWSLSSRKSLVPVLEYCLSTYLFTCFWPSKWVNIEYFYFILHVSEPLLISSLPCILSDVSARPPPSLTISLAAYVILCIDLQSYFFLFLHGLFLVLFKSV